MVCPSKFVFIEFLPYRKGTSAVSTGEGDGADFISIEVEIVVARMKNNGALVLDGITHCCMDFGG